MEKQYKILVVEDSKLMRSVISKMLRDNGFEVFEAGDGKEALTILIQNRDISLISLDVEMPVMDGFETCRHIRLNNQLPEEIRDIPILFLTSHDSMEDRRKGFELGATDFVSKEFIESELIRTVRRILMPSDRLKGIQALVVDDSVIARKIVSQALLSGGVVSVEAENGRAAFEFLAAEPDRFDLIILDLDMPVMNGLELMRVIRKELGMHEIPVIMLSANKEKTTQLELFSAGATDYLTKPFLKEELIGRINAHLEVALANKKLKDSMRQVRKANHIITEISQERKELLHVMCHDLANPIGAIISVLDMVDDNPDLFMRFKDELRKTAKNGMAIIDLVRQLRAIDEKKVNIKLEEIELKKAILSSVSILQSKMNIKDIAVDIDVDESIVIIAEETSLVNSVLNNILTNAMKFSHEGDAILISAFRKKRYTELTIRDYGIGMPKKLLDKLFDSNHVVSRNGTAGEIGTGFGMALINKFMKMFGGRVSVKSWNENEFPDNHGTEVRLKLENAPE